MALQVEQNVEFVQKKRDEVAFSPNDQQSVESFLQLEKGGGGNGPFTQYYNSIMEKAASRSLLMNEKVKSPHLTSGGCTTWLLSRKADLKPKAGGLKYKMEYFSEEFGVDLV
ncbi:hypothetical protein CK203_062843 [Vitis vinifera]|uniref:Uncharacterized protein n=1 Tax=Vitis vinifera TaxID=29760 RepID=A0A438G8C1_VITVI|nr:hypothetical protein CK203_062843 [Vitis vinifera]